MRIANLCLRGRAGTGRWRRRCFGPIRSTFGRPVLLLAGDCARGVRGRTYDERVQDERDGHICGGLGEVQVGVDSTVERDGCVGFVHARRERVHNANEVDENMLLQRQRVL